MFAILAAVLATPLWIVGTRAIFRTRRRATLVSAGPRAGLTPNAEAVRDVERRLRAIFPRAADLTVENVLVGDTVQVFDASFPVPGFNRLWSVRFEITGGIARLLQPTVPITAIKRPAGSAALALPGEASVPAGRVIAASTTDEAGGELQRRLGAWLDRQVKTDWRFAAAGCDVVSFTWRRGVADLGQIVSMTKSFAAEVGVASAGAVPMPAPDRAVPQSPLDGRTPAIVCGLAAAYASVMSVWYLMARPAFVSPGSSVAPVLLFAFGLGVAAVSLWEATDRVVGTLGGLAIAAAALFIGGYDIAAVLLWPLFWAACASGKGCI